MLDDQQKAAMLLLQFEDGTKLDTCTPIGPQGLSVYLELVRVTSFRVNLSGSLQPRHLLCQSCHYLSKVIVGFAGGHHMNQPIAPSTSSIRNPFQAP